MSRPPIKYKEAAKEGGGKVEQGGEGPQPGTRGECRGQVGSRYPSFLSYFASILEGQVRGRITKMALAVAHAPHSKL